MIKNLDEVIDLIDDDSFRSTTPHETQDSKTPLDVRNDDKQVSNQHLPTESQSSVSKQFSYENLSLTIEDYITLSPDTYLNDSIIQFYLKWLHCDVLHRKYQHHVYIFSTYFFSKLSSCAQRIEVQCGTEECQGSVKTRSRSKQHEFVLKNINQLKKWTKDDDLSSKKVILFPICENFHWYLIGVFNIPNIFLPQTTRLVRGGEPYIIVFDSLEGSNHHQSSVQLIRVYLNELIKSKKLDNDELVELSEHNVTVESSIKYPLQDNSCDCGIFLLHYVELMFQRITVFFAGKYSSTVTSRWFSATDVVRWKRSSIATLIRQMWCDSTSIPPEFPDLEMFRVEEAIADKTTLREEKDTKFTEDLQEEEGRESNSTNEKSKCELGLDWIDRGGAIIGDDALSTGSQTDSQNSERHNFHPTRRQQRRQRQHETNAASSAKTIDKSILHAIKHGVQSAVSRIVASTVSRLPFKKSPKTEENNSRKNEIPLSKNCSSFSIREINTQQTGKIFKKRSKYECDQFQSNLLYRNLDKILSEQMMSCSSDFRPEIISDDSVTLENDKMLRDKVDSNSLTTDCSQKIEESTDDNSSLFQPINFNSCRNISFTTKNNNKRMLLDAENEGESSPQFYYTKKGRKIENKTNRVDALNEELFHPCGVESREATGDGDGSSTADSVINISDDDCDVINEKRPSAKANTIKVADFSKQLLVSQQNFNVHDEFDPIL